jgi:hypothetical protein
MSFSQNETVVLIQSFLSWSKQSCRRRLFERLVNLEKNEAQFYSAIVENEKSLKLTTDQWFELLSRLPNRVLHSQLDLNGLLSEEQLKKLPQISG